MERDFLGIGGGRDVAMREEAGYLGKSAVQWPFSTVAPSKQQFMNFQGAQEERSKQLLFDQVSSSSGFQLVGADAFNPAHRSHSMKHLGTDGEGTIHQFQLPGFPSRGSEPFNGPAANHPSEIMTFPAVSRDCFPIGTSGPLVRASCPASGTTPAITSLKQQHQFGWGPTVAPSSAGPLTASVASREMIKPPGGSAQLTMFYGGTVNVYDDVPLEKALAIMFLAGNASSVQGSSVGNVPVQAGVAAPTKISMIETKNIQTHLTPARPALSSPISAASHSGAQSGSGSNSTVDVTGAKTTISLAPTGQQEPPKSMVTTAVGSASGAPFVPRAVPQARKASLARFLEKRKERVTSVAPYPSPQKLTDYTPAVDGKSVPGEPLHPSTMEQSWCLSAQHRNTSHGSNTLSTKLEI